MKAYFLPLIYDLWLVWIKKRSLIFSSELLWEAFPFPRWRSEFLQMSPVLAEPDQRDLPSHACSGEQGGKNKMPCIWVPAVILIDSNGNTTVPLNQVYEIFIFPFTQGCAEMEPSFFQVKELCFYRHLFIRATTNISCLQQCMPPAVQKLWMLKLFGLAEYLSHSYCQKFLRG